MTLPHSARGKNPDMFVGRVSQSTSVNFWHAEIMRVMLHVAYPKDHSVTWEQL